MNITGPAPISYIEENAAMIEDCKDDNRPPKKSAFPGSLETSILAAHMKFFRGNSGIHYRLDDEESVLYDAVIGYFMGSA